MARWYLTCPDMSYGRTGSMSALWTAGLERKTAEGSGVLSPKVRSYQPSQRFFLINFVRRCNVTAGICLYKVVVESLTPTLYKPTTLLASFFCCI